MLRIKLPCSPSCIAVEHIPRATPACGNNVIPKYLQMLGLHFVAFALIIAPKYLPKQRKIMYTRPIPTIAISANTSNSNSAPLITKNNARSGELHLSEAFIRSSDNGQMLQKIVPNIIHTNNDEKPTCT